jgi:tetratricopeptide (TPR) repeat protein
LDEAIELYRDALERSRRVNGPDHPATWLTLANLGNTLRLRGDADQAEQHLRAALDGQSKHLGVAAPATLEASHNLSQLLMSAGRGDEALQLTQQAYEAVRGKPDCGPALAVRVRQRHAAMLLQNARFAEAEPIARETLSIAEPILKPTSPLLAQIKSTLADSLQGQGRADEAARLRPRPATTSVTR